MVLGVNLRCRGASPPCEELVGGCCRIQWKKMIVFGIENSIAIVADYIVIGRPNFVAPMIH